MKIVESSHCTSSIAPPPPTHKLCSTKPIFIYCAGFHKSSCRLPRPQVQDAYPDLYQKHSSLKQHFWVTALIMNCAGLNMLLKNVHFAWFRAKWRKTEDPWHLLIHWNTAFHNIYQNDCCKYNAQTFGTTWSSQTKRLLRLFDGKHLAPEVVEVCKNFYVWNLARFDPQGAHKYVEHVDTPPELRNKPGS